MTDLAALVLRLEADASGYLKALDNATKRLNKFHKDQEDALNQINDKLREFASNVVAAFAVEKIAEFTMGAIEAQAATAKLSQELGISVEKLSEIQLAFASSGLGAEDTTASMKKLDIAISDAAGSATSKAGVAFRLLGVNVKDASGNIKSQDVILRDIADVYSKSADGANKVAINQALMGKGALSMIPMLNQGSAALDKIAQAARDSGAAMSKQAADAAEELMKKLNLLKAETTMGLSNAIANQLVPVLLDMANAMGSASERGESIKVIAAEIVTGFKIIASIGLEVARTFQLIGMDIGNLAAQAVALAHGSLSEVNALQKASSEDHLAIDKKYADLEAALWKDRADTQISEADRAAKGAADKQALGSIKGGQEQDKAIATLKAFGDQLKTQALTYKLGDAALVQYDLTVGKYAEDVKLAGEQGKALAASALAAAKQLQFEKAKDSVDKLRESLQQTIAAFDQSNVAAFRYKITSGETAKQLNLMADGGKQARTELTALNNQIIDDKDKKAIAALNDEITKTKGRFEDAGVAAFNLQNATLIKDVNERGDTGGQAAIAERRDQLAYMDAYNEQVAKATALEKQLGDVQGAIMVQRAQGQITDQQAEQRIDAARKQEIGGLQQILATERQIATDSGIPELTTKTDAFSASIDQLKVQTDLLEKSVRDNLEASFAHNFEDLIDGAKSFRDALKGFLKDIEKMFLDQISKNYAQQLFGTGGPAGSAPGFLSQLMSGASGSSSGSGGLSGFLAGLKGGGASTSGAVGAGVGEDALSSLAGLGFAQGGTIPTGSFGLVGENGPEFAYSGNRDLQIQPIAGANKQELHVHNNFTVQSSNGTISRTSQSQTAALAARSLQSASARNNR